MKTIDLRSDIFDTRYDLDRHVEALVFRSSEPLSEFVIQGTKEQLNRFSLDSKVKVHGVSVVVLPDPRDEVYKKKSNKK